jgi:mRNA-degrading endonuclease RelE of RelBE toxin-antitoxin system
MAFKVLQTKRFSRSYKKLHNNIATDVDAAVVKIADDPTLGEKKKGDLAKLYVCKFYSQNQLYLLGYSIDDVIELLTLEVVGSHENFHRDFKK